jgi:catechol 2,3-dioxygenase-like lactoylglutathione lyase family enzyme
MALLDIDSNQAAAGDGKISYYGVHHLALNTDDMKMTVDFYVRVLGMRLVHAMRVPPGIGSGPGNRGNPPFEEIRHYFFDMGRDALLAFFEMPKGAKGKGDRNALGNMQHVSFAVSPASQARIRRKSCPVSSRSTSWTRTTSGSNSVASRRTVKASR